MPALRTLRLADLQKGQDAYRALLGTKALAVAIFPVGAVVHGPVGAIQGEARKPDDRLQPPPETTETRQQRQSFAPLTREGSWETVRLVRAMLGRHLGFKPDDDAALGYFNIQEIVDIVRGLLLALRLFLSAASMVTLAVGAVGFMGKMYAEAIESIDAFQVQAVAATGASRTQTFMYGVVPQALPIVASYSLLLLETNIRAATILGIVGAGGIGFVLNRYMALFQYQHLMGAMLLVVLAVTGVDRLSDLIRKRLL